jgi:hypothetical protein
MQVTFVQCSLRFMGKNLWKIQVYLRGINSSKRAHVKITNEDNTHHFFCYQGYCSLWIHSTRPNSQLSLWCMWKYWSGHMKLCVEKDLNFGPTIGFSTMTMFSSQGTLCQVDSGPKIDYWNITPILVPWFGSEWLLAVSRNKVHLKGTKISGYWKRINVVITAQMTIPQQEFQKCFQQQQHHWANNE